MITEVTYSDRDGRMYVEYRARVMGSQGYWKVRDFTSKAEAESWCRCNQTYAGNLPDPTHK